MTRVTADVHVRRRGRRWEANVQSVGLIATERGSMYRVRADTRVEALRLATLWAQEYAEQLRAPDPDRHVIELTT